MSSTSTTIAVGVSLAIFSLILIGALIFFFIRRNRSPFADQEASSGAGHKRLGSVVLDKSHPAAKAITPFPGVTRVGAGEGPRFNHKPGENMRVAHRRSDGGWSFSGPLALNTNSHHPPGLAPPKSDLTSPSRHHLLSPSSDTLASPHAPALSPSDARTVYSPTSTIFTIVPPSAQGIDKEKKLAPGELTTRGFVEVDLEGDFPPAYSFNVGDDENFDEGRSSHGHGGRRGVHH